MSKWTIISARAVDKQAQQLSEKVLLQLRLLFMDLENKGPVAIDWPNYSKLRGKKGTDRRHCHLQKGKPTYVCCWEVKVNIHGVHRHCELERFLRG